MSKIFRNFVLVTSQLQTMYNFYDKYCKILETLRQFCPETSGLKQVRTPKLSDIELLAIEFTAESQGIDSERNLFRQLPPELSSKIERSVYNRRRRHLFAYKKQVQSILADILNEGEDYYVVDSMPLEVCKLSRSSRSKICKEDFETAPDKGYCATQDLYYYGYKFHGVCSIRGVFSSFDLTKASVADIKYLKDIKYDYHDCKLLGDKGYLSAQYQLDLFESSNIQLEVPYRLNQKNFKPYPKLLRSKRKRIETLFSQLCDQFMIRRNYTKSFSGFSTRVLSKITTVTVIQMINKLNNRNINNLKAWAA